MKKLLFIVSCAIILGSCAKPCYQLYNVDYISNPQNPDISVYYDFWDEKGRMAFKLKNNTGKILTIHTDKCFFVYNDMSNCHYNGEIVSENSGRIVSFSAFSDMSIGYSSGTSNTIIQQRFFNIAPKGSHSFNSFILNDKHITTPSLRITPYRKEVKTAEYVPETSPIRFTNVITYSIDGSQETHTIETEFYVNKISNIHRYMFLKLEKAWPLHAKTYSCPYASPMSFYTIYYR